MTATAPQPRVALVHDYLTQRGGAERVALRMAQAFPGAPLFTSLYESASTFPEFGDVDVHTSVLDRVRLFRRDHRRALPLLAPVFSTMRLGEPDVVLASSSGWAHGVHTDAPKVVFCHNPARWLYQTDQYLDAGARVRRMAVGVLRRPLIGWDKRAARSARRYLCQSTAVRDRIRAAYGIDPEILPPPPGLDPLGPMQAPPENQPEPGYVLCVSRLMPYKNVDAVIAAFEAMPGLRLVVVGDGPDRSALTARAGANVRLVGKVDDATLRWFYTHCSAVVAASYEDYGLTPLEGLAFGRPSAVVRWGGFVDTVIEGRTGIFFDRPEPALITEAVRIAVDTPWDADELSRHLQQFGAARFADGLRRVVAEVA